MSDRLIVALDTPDVPLAKRLATTVGRHCAAFKVGSTLFNAYAGMGAVPNLVRGSMLDLKFHDIPEQVYDAVLAVLPLGPRWLTVHASGGRAMIEAARRACETAGERRPLVLAVTVLTSLAPGDTRALGFGGGHGYLSARWAKIAMAAGADGVVCSPISASQLRRTVGGGIIVTPGVRPIDADNDDHALTITPGDAIRGGADFVVVGRPITRAPDPAAAAHAISQDIQANFAVPGADVGKP